MIFVIKKKTILTVGILILTITLLSVLVFSNSIVPAYAINKKLPVYYVDSSENTVAISFDAAWGSDKTLAIMDILDEYDCKATFFLVGFWVDEYPELVKEINNRGHLIGNHGSNHLHMNKLNTKEIDDEITQTSLKINQLVGYMPTYFRAPFGEYNNRLIEYAESSSIQVIQWDVDTLDWKGLSGAKIAEIAMNKAKSGSIILCHNDSDNILDALPLMLIGLKNKGLKPVRMDELVLKTDYRIETDGRQVKNNT